MRTTLTLDADVARLIRARMASRKSSLKDVVNEAVRSGLEGGRPSKSARFTVEPHSFGFRAGIDPDKLGQMVDELETEETVGEFLR